MLVDRRDAAQSGERPPVPDARVIRVRRKELGVLLLDGQVAERSPERKAAPGMDARLVPRRKAVTAV
jgi:hypothetical protein